jgi:hypothetical protein
MAHKLNMLKYQTTVFQFLSTLSYFNLIKIHIKMATFSFPTSNADILVAGEKLFSRVNEDGDACPTRILTQYDFPSLGKNQFTNWKNLNKLIIDSDESLRLMREQRDRIWITELRPAFLAAKKVIVGAYIHTPIVVGTYGFAPTLNPAKRLTAEESIGVDVKRLAVKMNALEESKAVAQKSTTAVSLSFNDVTKSAQMLVD